MRQRDADAVGVDLHRSRDLHDVRNALHADPDTRIAAHCPAVQAEIQYFLYRRRKQHRDQAGLEQVIALVRQRRGLGGVVVAGHHQDSAMARRAGGVGMLEDVAAAVHARPLAVPHAEYAVIARAREQVHLLGAPYRRSGQVFVDAGLEDHVVGLQVLGRLPHVQVHAAQGGPAITRNKARCIQAGPHIPHALHHGQAHQCVDSAHPGAAGLQGIFVVELDRIERGVLCRR
ncbi:hypothetical protein BOFL111202_14705 [Bordetella flabilis]